MKPKRISVENKEPASAQKSGLAQPGSPPRIAARSRVSWTRGLAIIGYLMVVLALGIWVRLFLAPFPLPASVQEQIVARADGAMAASELRIDDMVVALDERGRVPSLEMRDVVLRAPDGSVRAAFPVVRAQVAPLPLLRGRVRIRSVYIGDAGLNLTRSADGRVGIDLAGATPERSAAEPGSEVPAVSLTETLARFDQMFSNEAFSHLREVRGERIEVQLTNEVSGRSLRLHEAGFIIRIDGPELALNLSGSVEGRREALVEISASRDREAGRSQLELNFDNLALRDIAESGPEIAWLSGMTAPVNGALSAVLNDDGSVGDVSGQVSLGAGEAALPGLAGGLAGGEEPITISSFETAFAYDPTSRRAQVTRIGLVSDALSFEGRAVVDLSPVAREFVTQLTLSDIELNPVGVFESPLRFEGGAADLRVRLRDGVRVELADARLYHEEHTARLAGRLGLGTDRDELAIDARIDRANVPFVLRHWPLGAIPGTRAWVTDRLGAASVRGVDFSMRRVPGARPDIELSFDFEEAEITALPALPPIEGGSGFFHLSDGGIRVFLDDGEIAAPERAPLSLAGSVMRIDDLSENPARAEFEISVDGTLPDLMHLMDGPPFRVLAASPLSPGDIGSGRIEGTIDLGLRVGPRPAGSGLRGIDLDVAGVVTDYQTARLVPGRPLSARRLNVVMSPSRLRVEGSAALDSVPLTGSWAMGLGPDAAQGSEVRARIELSPANLSRFGVELPDWLLSGRGPADVTVALRRDQDPVLSLTSDLSGIGLAIPALGYRHPQGRSGSLSARIRLGPEPSVSSLNVDASGLVVQSSISLTPQGTLDRLNASRFQLSNWLNVSGSLIGRGSSAPSIEVNGGVLDIRSMPSLSNSPGPSGDMGPLNVNLDRLQITQGIALTDLRAELDGSTMAGAFRGSINGTAPVTGRLVPSANGPSIRLQSNDGGAVLRAAGIFQSLFGGTLDLSLVSRPQTGHYEGQAQLMLARLRDAPAMAELLNLVSVVGLLEQLGQEGINMGQVDVDFLITPEQILLREGTAVGPSLGVSMEGAYDVATTRYQMQGVISPLYFVNGLFGGLVAPRREGVFGFNYRVEGQGDRSSVSVNPLSLLTPGIFREIFRAPLPDFEGQ